MTHAIWTTAAVADLDDIKTYLTETCSANFAQHMLNALILSARWLAANPRAGAPLDVSGWRKWKPRKTRYVLIYEPVEDGISIYRVRHERNDWHPVPE